MFSKMMMAASLSFMLVSGSARAETTIELKGTHLCCGACYSAANAILKKVEGVKGKAEGKIITIAAADDATVQKALDALAAGGFHGDTGNKTLVQKDDSGVTKGKVKTLTLTGIHNCCGQCNGKIVTALKSVKGVEGNTAKAKNDTFDVTGDFDAADVVSALMAAGFHCKVKN